MSRLAAPGFSRLKAPGCSSSRQSSAIVTPTSGTPAPQIPSGTATQQIPGGTTAPRARSSFKKTSNPEAAAPQSEDHQIPPKIVKPVVRGFFQKGSKTTKLSANQAAQHGTGPYDRTKQSGTIPYVGKKRPSGVLKAPDSRTNTPKQQITDGTVKAKESLMADPKGARKKIVPPKSLESGMFAIPKPVNKRVSVPTVAKFQASNDLTKIESPRRQTIATTDSIRSNSKPGLVKNAVGIRPRSCIVPNKSSEIKKPEKRKSISKSLQNIPKSIPPLSTHKGSNKKDIVRKSGSHDDILSCTKEQMVVKKPVAGVVPRSIPSKFGFGKSAAERPRALSSNSTSKTFSTPDQSNPALKKFEYDKLSPIAGKYKSGVNRLEEAFDASHDLVDATDDHSDTKTINIIINLDTVVSTEDVNATSMLTKNDGLSTSATLNGNIIFDSPVPLNETKNIDLNTTALTNEIDLNTTTTLSDEIDLNTKEILNNKIDLNTTTILNRQIDSNTTKILNNEIDLNTTTTLNNQIDLNTTKILNNKIDLNTTTTLNNQVDLNTTTTLNNQVDLNTTTTLNNQVDLNTTSTLNNTTTTLNNENCKHLNTTCILQKNEDFCLHDNLDKSTNSDVNLFNQTKTYGERDLLNETQILDKSILDKLNKTHVLETCVIDDANETRIIANDSLDKSDSGFDDTNYFNISGSIPTFVSSISPRKHDLSVDGDLSDDVLKVIAAISSNINRTCNVPLFSQSPIKTDTSSIPQKSQYICTVAQDEVVDGNNEDLWLTESAGQNYPALEASHSQEIDEANTIYQTDDLLSKSTSVDMSTATYNNTQFEDTKCYSNYDTNKFSSNYNDRPDTQSRTTAYTEDNIFKVDIDGEDISLCTDISQSTDHLRNCLSSIGTDTEDIEDPDINQTVSLSSHENTGDNNECVSVKSNEIDDLPNIGLQDQVTSLPVDMADTYYTRDTLFNTHLSVDEVISEGDIEMNTSIKSSEVNVPIADNSINYFDDPHNSVHSKAESISKEIADAIIRDSGHSTDMNENEINAVLNSDMNELVISDVKTDLLADGVFSEHIPEVCHVSPPDELEKLMSSEATYPSTPPSRQSLEYDLTRRCNTIDCTRKMKKVARSRTYSSNELITKFRIPKELKCVETCEGDILMDKTTFLHFINEVKLVKTQLLKLKRTLVEAQCTSPLVKSPLKRANSAVEASAIPPLSPRTCQCSPMAVVNPLVLSTGSTSMITKGKENIISSQEVAILNEKLQDSASTIKLLQTQLENHEQKEQDIIEENILLREEISHLTEHLRNTRTNEGGSEEQIGSFDELELAVDLESRLSILERLYSDGQ